MGIYIITDTKLTPYKNIEHFLIPAFEGGCKILQLRDKELGDKELLEYALEIQKLCFKYNVLFIVNDRCDLANQIKADGIHLGIEDCKDEEFMQIRKNFEGVIGISCYDDLNRAKKYQDLGADYVAFGSCFKSSTKPDAKAIDLSTLKEAKKNLNIPICAIGGINENNISQIKEQSPDMIAIISDIWMAKNIKNKVQALKSII